MMRYEPKVDGIARPYTLGWHQYSYVETGAGDVLFSEKGDRDCKIRVSYARHISLR